MTFDEAVREYQLRSSIGPAQKSINWTIFIQLIKQHLRYDYYYKN